MKSLRQTILTLLALLLSSHAFASAPTTYSARTDACETGGTGTDTGCTGQPAMTFLGRSSTSSGVFTPTDVPPDLTTSGNPLNGRNKCTIDPDFHTKICRATDYAVGTSFTLGSGGDVALWAKDHSEFLVVTSGGVYQMVQFSGSTMLSTPTSIGGTGTPGCTTNCHTFAGGTVSFSSTDGGVLYELDTTQAPTHFFLNKLSLHKDVTGFPGSFDRALVYDFAKSSHCLPTDFQVNWVGSFNISADDNVFAFAMSDHGQNGVRDGTHPYGATFLVVYDQRHPDTGNGAACRILKTYGGAGNGYGPMVVDGDWGPTGSVLMGTDQQPANTDGNCTVADGSPDVCYPNTVALGTSQGPTLLDSMYLHNGGPAANNNYIVLSGSDINSCTTIGARSTCYCKPGTSAALCEAYTWETATLNIRPNLPEGHNVKGNLGSYRGNNYSFFTYHDPYIKLADLLSISIPVDQHGTPSNLDSGDHQPIAFVSADTCGTGSGPGNHDCITAYNAPYYDEFVMVENQAVYGSAAQHCLDSLGHAVACAYRMSHTFSSGTSWSFGAGNAISNISPDGQFALISTDWFAHSPTTAGANSGFGCTNGDDGKTAGHLCLNNLDSNGKGMLYAITAAHESGSTVTFTSTQHPYVGSVITVKGFTNETRLNKQWTVLTSSATNWTAHATVTGLADDAGGTGNYDCGNGGLVSTPCPRSDVVVINLITAGTVH